VQGVAGHDRLGEAGQRQRVAPRPGRHLGDLDAAWLPDRPRLNAQPYSAVRNTEAGGRRAASAIRTGVMVASASAIPARVCAATCGHFIAAQTGGVLEPVTVTVAAMAQHAGCPVA
jgi:hypothetical protein